ncbi:hypothetical protein SAMN05660900_01946 [Megasphaera cerevisiae DSM 20462]|nr:hypothetical protein SAMN05660900_01946 [Megasphaera cerevisiae DSM 20462]
MEADKAKEEAKLESQQTTIITAADIAKKQAKSVEDIIFSETGVSRTVDAMGRVTVSIREGRTSPYAHPHRRTARHG